MIDLKWLGGVEFPVWIMTLMGFEDMKEDYIVAEIQEIDIFNL